MEKNVHGRQAIDESELEVGFTFYRIITETGSLQTIKIVRVAKFAQSFYATINNSRNEYQYRVETILKFGIKDKLVALELLKNHIEVMQDALARKHQEVLDELYPKQTKEEKLDI